MKLQLDPNSSKPLHQQAEDLLRQMIQQEEYRKGKLLPNEVELSKELNIQHSCPEELSWRDMLGSPAMLKGCSSARKDTGRPWRPRT